MGRSRGEGTWWAVPPPKGGPCGNGPGAGREAAEALGECLCRLQVCQDRRWPGLGTHFSQEKAGLSKALTHQGLRAFAWPGG